MWLNHKDYCCSSHCGSLHLNFERHSGTSHTRSWDLLFTALPFVELDLGGFIRLDAKSWYVVSAQSKNYIWGQKCPKVLSLMGYISGNT